MWLAYATLAAVFFGFRGILYHWTSQRPIDRNLMLLGVYCCGAVITLTAALAFGQNWSAAVWTGILMGAFSFVSNASMYKGFAVGKASLVAVFTALTPVVVAALSYVLWHEKLNAGQAVSFLVIIAGIVLIRYSNDLSLRNLQGVQWAILAMFAFSITDLASKQAMLWNAAKLPTLFAMFSTGSVLFFLLWSFQRLRAGRRAASGTRALSTSSSSGAAVRVSQAAEQADGRKISPLLGKELWPARKTFFWGAVVGLSNIGGMLLVLPAFQLGLTGLVSAVLATNVLLILLYARVILKEHWSVKEMLGMVCALLGVLGLRLLG